MNRLSNETSPYLLQHQHNPVDWYAWGPEAFEAARRLDKPIFVSVGYSTCYWCHVMERQSFENAAVAAVMNEHFINIKVDREERPDVDQLYMTAVQILTQQGGWPMSVWLTPELKPFYGGTYFPPEDSHGRPGFTRILLGIADAYTNRRDEVEQSANHLVQVLGRVSKLVPPTKDVTLDNAWVDQMIARTVSDYDARNGGFGRAPKFPRQTQLELLLRWLDAPNRPDRTSDHSPDLKQHARVKQMLTHTLDAMALGGIRDQLGGGFHRYSTDAKWLVPHFEIMLYDQGMLGWVYAEAYRQFGDARYAAIARGIFDFVLREMTSPAGAFYTAFDAEVDSQEGLNYLWTFEEVRRSLTDEPGKGMGAPFSDEQAELFAKVYGLDQGPNFVDPHHSNGGPDKNILFVADPNLADANEPILARMRQYLHGLRAQRKQPLLDTKILTSWNALMIRALAHGGKVLKEDRYIRAAAVAAEFLLKEHRSADGGLLRSSRDGVKKYAGMLDDYTFLAAALLELHAATGEAMWKTRAEDIAKQTTDRFADATTPTGGNVVTTHATNETGAATAAEASTPSGDGAFFFTERTATDLIVRQKIGTDSPLPSGNGVAAGVLLALGQSAEAGHVLTAFAQQVDAHGEGMSAMVQAALAYIETVGPLEVAAGPAIAAQPQSPDEVAAGVVSMGARWDGPTTLRLTLDIAAGYHLNAHPAGDDLVPTEISVDGAVVKSIDYPPGKDVTFPFADQPIPVYEKQAVIRVQFADEPKGRMTVSIVYQACTDAACLPPVRKAAAFEV